MGGSPQQSGLHALRVVRLHALLRARVFSQRIRRVTAQVGALETKVNSLKVCLTKSEATKQSATAELDAQSQSAEGHESAK